MPEDRRLYIIIASGNLESLVQVEHWSKNTAKMFLGEKNAPDRDVFGWVLNQPKYNNAGGSTGKVRIEWNWKLTQNDNQWKLTKKERVEVKTEITTTETEINITIDDEVGEGFWRMSRTKHTKYRGSLARFPDKTETERDEGAFWPVLRR